MRANSGPGTYDSKRQVLGNTSNSSGLTQSTPDYHRYVPNGSVKHRGLGPGLSGTGVTLGRSGGKAGGCIITYPKQVGFFGLRPSSSVPRSEGTGTGGGYIQFQTGMALAITNTTRALLQMLQTEIYSLGWWQLR